MLKVTKKYNANLATIRMTATLRAQLPAWYHPATDTAPMNNRKAKCLAEKHGVLTVADLLTVSMRMRNPKQAIPHWNNPYCPCIACIDDRLQGCTNPSACASEAHTRTHKTYPKYNPLHPGDPHDNLSLTSTRKIRNENARQNNNLILFDPSITTKTSLADCFRIFTDPNRISKYPAQRYYARGIRMRCRPLQIFTDGACFENGKKNAQCGSRIWIKDGDHRNEAIRVPRERQSNQIGEIAAVIKAAGAAYLFQPLVILTDSKYVIDGLTKHLSNWEDQGWINIKNAPHLKKAAHTLKRHTVTTHFQWVKGHASLQGNEESDRLAKAGAEKQIPDHLDLTVPQEFDLQGAKLSTLTQSIAYKGIIQNKNPPDHPSSMRNLQTMRDTVVRFTNSLETDETLWHNMRHKEIRTKIRQFLYKAMHSTQKIGPFWRGINNFEDRQYCRTCGESESMSHILTTCQATPRRLIWGLVKQYWPCAKYRWPTLNLGIILGCGSISAQPTNANQRNRAQQTRKSRTQGASRLLRILISESAHLIWVLRCERVIQERQHGENKIKARWLRAINARLTNNRITATRIKREKGFTNLIVNTWEQVLNKTGDLPNNWLNNHEVLVGRR